MRVHPFIPCAMALLATGCSLMPYVPSERLDRSFATSEVAGAGPVYFAGDVELALRDVDAQRAAYYLSLRSRTYFREGLSTALIGLSALAVYRGVTATTDGGRRMVTRFGVTSGAAYAAGSYSDNPQAEDSYVQAAEDLTCLAMRTRPWLMTSTDYEQFKVDMKTLQTAIDKLEIAYGKAHVAMGNDTEGKKSLRYYGKALYTARSTLRSASHYRGYVDSAGFQLRQEAALVVSRTNSIIRHAQQALLSPASIVTQLTAVDGAFRNIKPPPVDGSGGASDAKTQDTGDGDGSANNLGGSAPDPATSASAAASADKVVKELQATTQRVGANTKSTKADLKKLEDQVAQLRERLLQSAKQPADLSHLQAATSNVFIAMRPVTLVLTRAYSLRPYVKGIPECKPRGDQPLQFAPDTDDVTVTAGHSLDVAVTGGVGVPHIWLARTYSGKAGNPAKLVTNIDGGLARATLTIPSDLPDGELTVMAVDHSGRHKDELKVVVKAAAPASAPASAPEPAASAASKAAAAQPKKGK